MQENVAQIHRDPKTKKASFHVKKEVAWRLSVGVAPGADRDDGRLVLEGEGAGIFSLPDELREWTLFYAAVGEENFFLAERLLPMAGGFNFRDLGGFRGAGGKRVVWGKFFRTDDMMNLTECDLAYLASIPIESVTDFRTRRERGEAPDRLPKTVKKALHYPVAPGFLNPFADKTTRYATADEFMSAVYRDLALDPGIAETYKRFFAHARLSGTAPLLFHCSAGKDRTGVAAALILLALGVDRKTVLDDYEASNEHLGEKYAERIAADKGSGGLYTVKRAFLEETLGLLEDAHGSVETYLARVLDVDVAAMRAAYLY